jgi:hypothetical protein
VRLAYALLLVACAKPTPPPPQQAADPLDEKLRHCPLTVEGAKTHVRNVDGGIELVVRVETPEQLAELERRVHHIEEFARTNGNAGGRHGTGKGGGTMRNCPIVSHGTTVTDEPVESGFRIVVRPNNLSEVELLRAATLARIAELPPH